MISEPKPYTCYCGLFAASLLMEIVSIGMFDQSKARLTWSQILIATTEALFVTSIFSVMYNHVSP